MLQQQSSEHKKIREQRNNSPGQKQGRLSFEMCQNAKIRERLLNQRNISVIINLLTEYCRLYKQINTILAKETLMHFLQYSYSRCDGLSETKIFKTWKRKIKTNRYIGIRKYQTI